MKKLLFIMLLVVIGCQKQDCFECTQSSLRYKEESSTIWSVDNITDTTRRESCIILNLGVYYWQDSTFSSLENIFIDTDTLKVNCKLQ